MNRHGRKNTIIGTVSFGGSAAAFFSASVMRMSRFSCAITRKRLAERRAVAFRLLQGQTDRLDAVEAGALRQVLVGHLAVLQIGELGRGQREFFRSATDCVPISLATLRNADFDRHAGLDADQQQVERVGKGALDRKLALGDRVLQEQHRRL